MPFTPSKNQPTKKPVSITQSKWPKGYISTLQESRIPNDGMIDLTNMEVVQDGLLRPRPSTVPFGPDLLGTCIGVGTFEKITSGVPEHWLVTMQVIGGVGKIVINKDGGSWTTVSDPLNSYDASAWTIFTQSNSRVYVSNGVDTMSYYDINAGTIKKYTALTTPSAPTATPTGLTGTNFSYRYRISANNNVGETAASVATTVSVGIIRDNWVSGTQYVDLSWSAVSGATSYNVYVGTTLGGEEFLITVTGTNYRDDSTATVNTFKTAPAGDSTAGPKLKYLIDDNGQLFGVGDVNNPYYLWYSGQGMNSGDFSPFNGGGYVGINYGGDSLPIAVSSFRDGKGNPVITVQTKGQSGTGKLYHAAPQTQTVGDTVINYFQVYEANGQTGTNAPHGVVEANNNIYYPAGDAFKSTGTQANIVNILATNSVSQAIDPDVQNLNQSAMEKAVGLYHNNKIYWALPNGTTENNEIWYMDLSRNNLWVLRWTLPAKWMWLYEDNSGNTHHCALVNNTIVEFTRSVATTDGGVPFRTRAASGSVVFDEGGIAMAAIQFQRFKLFYPKGTIAINAYGLGEDSAVQTLASDTYTTNVSATGYGQFDYSGAWLYGADVGTIDYYSQSVVVRTLEVDEILNEIKWEIVTENADCDYTASSVTTTGKAIPNLYYGD